MSANTRRYSKPCKRCGRLHGQTMVQRVRRGFKTTYRAANFPGSEEWPTIRDAELDACDHWATQREEGAVA